jgi:hypothetical protein
VQRAATGARGWGEILQVVLIFGRRRIEGESASVGTKYAKSAQTGDEGVALVRKIVTSSDAVYRGSETPDLGVDGTIELLRDDREPSGDLVLVQIKSGSSYIRKGRFYVDADRSHFETWSRYAVPVVGIVCDPDRDEGRWVDISAYLRDHPQKIAHGPYTIEAPASQPFSRAAFPKFIARFRRPRAPITRVDTTPNLLIRKWGPADTRATRALLQPIAIDYPNFEAWLNSKFSDDKASKKVVALGDTIAAFSMWQAKDDRNVKLQTFMVGPLFRGTSIGQHLLYHELRNWARNPRIERIHVTISSSKADLIDYFQSFGFRVEGFAPNRYDRAGDAAELVMAKHLVRQVVRTPADLKVLAEYLTKRIWGIRAGSADRFGVTTSNMGVQAALPAATVKVSEAEETIEQRISVVDESRLLNRTYDDAALMEEFYPLRIHLAKKRYMLVPIFQQWVDAMLSISGPGTSLKLRVDNAYYCYPKVSNLARGDLVIFYEPKKDGGRGAAIGAALVLEQRIDKPKALYSRFAKLGIYRLEDVAQHANAAGDALAIRFGLFEPFEKPVTLARIRDILRKATNVQGLTPIDRDSFEVIRSEGLATEP